MFILLFSISCKSKQKPEEDNKGPLSYYAGTWYAYEWGDSSNDKEALTINPDGSITCLDFKAFTRGVKIPASSITKGHSTEIGPGNTSAYRDYYYFSSGGQDFELELYTNKELWGNREFADNAPGHIWWASRGHRIYIPKK